MDTSAPQPEAKARTPADLTPQISRRAYELYEERGRPNGPAVGDWRQAEQEIRNDEPKAEAKSEGKPEPKPENKPASKPEDNAGAKPEQKPEPKPGAKVEPKAEPKPENKTTPVSSGPGKALVAGLLVLAVLVALALGFGLGRWSEKSKKDPNQLILYGNVDLRQVELAFNNTERLTEVLVQEGDKVARGQVLARLDPGRLRPLAAAAAALADAQLAAVQKLHHGSRPEEIAQAQANVASAQADQVNAAQQWQRLTALAQLTTGRAISQQDLEAAKAALDMALARLEVAQKALDLATLGPRTEDIAQSEAQLRANQAQLALLNQELADAELVAPLDAVVRSRLLEPGEMVSPQRPVFNLAITDPKWVRAYVAEPALGRIHPGMKAAVTTDSFPGRSLPGWVGFISSVAEFTPKTVQTEELRPNLVYEIRVFVPDPQDELRLGMPANVTLELDPPAQNQP